METYERMRREFAAELKKNGIEDERILSVLDFVAAEYSIEPRERGNRNGMAVLEEYLSACEYEKMSPGTINNYRLILRGMVQTLDVEIERIRTADLRGYLTEYQKQRGTSDRTINKYREYFRAFFAWCVNEGYISANPAAGLKPIRCEKKQKEHFSQSDLEHIRAACRDERDIALVEFLYSTGCRVSELCGLKKSDIDWVSKTVRLFGKGKKQRVSYLNAKAEFYLQHYLSTRTDTEESLFLSKRGQHSLTPAGVQKILRDIQGRIGDDFGKAVTPHVFRHTTATTALRAGMPVEDIQALLGHENIETTMIYAKASDANVQSNHKKYVI